MMKLLTAYMDHPQHGQPDLTPIIGEIGGKTPQRIQCKEGRHDAGVKRIERPGPARIQEFGVDESQAPDGHADDRPERYDVL